MGGSQSSEVSLPSIDDLAKDVENAIVDGVEQVGDLAKIALDAINKVGLAGSNSCDHNSPHKTLQTINFDKLMNGGNIVLFPEMIIKYDYIRNRCQTYNAITIPFPNINSLVKASVSDTIDKVSPDLNTLVSDIAAMGEQIKIDFEKLEDGIKKIEAFITELSALGDTATTIAETNEKLNELVTLYNDSITETTALLKTVIDNSQKLFTTNITCITEMFENIQTIIETFFNIDLPKFYSDDYTFKAKMFTINNRNKNLLNKLNTLNVCINVLSVCINEGLYLYTIKILYYIFSKQLIEIWKLIQYTIKYNLIDFHTMNPSLNKLVETEVYSTALQQIILRLLQMIRGTFDFSETLLDVAIHITKLVGVSLETFKFLEYLAGTMTSGLNTSQIKKQLETIVASLSPFGDPETFKNLVTVSSLETKNDNIAGVLKGISLLITGPLETSLKLKMQSIFITFVNCEGSNNLIDYHCKLEFNSTRKKDVNDIKTFINDTQDNIYSKINSISIDISKPYGWSYEENKQDIEDKINSRKT